MAVWGARREAQAHADMSLVEDFRRFPELRVGERRLRCATRAGVESREAARERLRMDLLERVDPEMLWRWLDAIVVNEIGRLKYESWMKQFRTAVCSLIARRRPPVAGPMRCRPVARGHGRRGHRVVRSSAMSGDSGDSEPASWSPPAVRADSAGSRYLRKWGALASIPGVTISFDRGWSSAPVEAPAPGVRS
jgi:hypothetical protein